MSVIAPDISSLFKNRINSKQLQQAINQLNNIKTLNQGTTGQFLRFIELHPPMHEAKDIVDDHRHFLKIFQTRIAALGPEGQIPAELDTSSKRPITNQDVRQHINPYALRALYYTFLDLVHDFNKNVIPITDRAAIFSVAYGLFKREVALRNLNPNMKPNETPALNYREWKSKDVHDDFYNRILPKLSKFHTYMNHPEVGSDDEDEAPSSKQDKAEVDVKNVTKDNDKSFDDSEMSSSKLNIDNSNAVRDSSSDQQHQQPQAITPDSETVSVPTKDPQTLAEHLNQLNQGQEIPMRGLPKGFDLNDNQDWSNQDEMKQIKSEDKQARRGQLDPVQTAIQMYYATVGKYLEQSLGSNYRCDPNMSLDEFMELCANANVPNESEPDIRNAYNNSSFGAKGLQIKLDSNIAQNLDILASTKSVLNANSNDWSEFDPLVESINSSKQHVFEPLIDLTSDQNMNVPMYDVQTKNGKIVIDQSLDPNTLPEHIKQKIAEVGFLYKTYNPSSDFSPQSNDFKETLKSMRKGLDPSGLHGYRKILALHDYAVYVKNDAMARNLAHEIKAACLKIGGESIRREINYQKPLPSEYIIKFMQDFKRIRSENPVLDDTLTLLQSPYVEGVNPNDESTWTRVMELANINPNDEIYKDNRAALKSAVLTSARKTDEVMKHDKDLADKIVHDAMYDYYEKYKYFKLFNTPNTNFTLAQLANASRRRSTHKLVLHNDRNSPGNSVYTPNDKPFVTGMSDGVVSDNVKVLNKLSFKRDKLVQRITSESQPKNVNMPTSESYYNHFSDLIFAGNNDAAVRNPQNIQIRDLNGEVKIGQTLNAVRNIIKGKKLTWL